MKILSIAAAKGGNLKTTTSLSIAVRAVQDGLDVAMIDLNFDQSDLTKWWHLRGRPKNPKLIPVKKLGQDITLLRKSGCDLLIIDCPPGDLDHIEVSIMLADFVLLPVKSGFFDVDATAAVVSLCKARHKPFSFLLAAVDSRMPKLVESAVRSLAKDGPILKSRIKYAQPYILSVARGKSASEIDKSFQPEIDALWSEVKALVFPATTPAIKNERRATT